MISPAVDLHQPHVQQRRATTGRLAARVLLRHRVFNYRVVSRISPPPPPFRDPEFN